MLAQNSDTAMPMAVTNTQIFPRKIKDEGKKRTEMFHKQNTQVCFKTVCYGNKYGLKQEVKKYIKASNTRN